MSENEPIVLNKRTIVQFTLLGLGVIMTMTGLVSIITPHPYPEFATAGITAILGTGLASTIGK